MREASVTALSSVAGSVRTRDGFASAAASSSQSVVAAIKQEAVSWTAAGNDAVPSREDVVTFEATGDFRTDYPAACSLLGITPHPAMVACCSEAAVSAPGLDAAAAAAGSATEQAEAAPPTSARKAGGAAAAGSGKQAPGLGGAAKKAAKGGRKSTNETAPVSEASVPQVTQLRVVGYTIDAATVSALSLCLPACSSIVEIILYNVAIAPEPLQRLLHLIVQSSSVVSLSVDMSPRLFTSGDSATTTVFDALLPVQDPLDTTAHSTLRMLSLRGNNLGDAAAVELASRLAYNRNIKALSLAVNALTSVGAEGVARALRTNRTLISLNLTNNCIGADGAIALTRALTRFRISHEDIVARRRLINQWTAARSAELEKEAAEAAAAGAGKSRGKGKSTPTKTSHAGSASRPTTPSLRNRLASERQALAAQIPQLADPVSAPALPEITDTGEIEPELPSTDGEGSNADDAAAAGPQQAPVPQPHSEMRSSAMGTVRTAATMHTARTAALRSAAAQVVTAHGFAALQPLGEESAEHNPLGFKPLETPRSQRLRQQPLERQHSNTRAGEGAATTEDHGSGLRRYGAGNNVLQRLCLAHNPLETDGLTALASMLQMNKTINKLVWAYTDDRYSESSEAAYRALLSEWRDRIGWDDVSGNGEAGSSSDFRSSEDSSAGAADKLSLEFQMTPRSWRSGGATHIATAIGADDHSTSETDVVSEAGVSAA